VIEKAPGISAPVDIKSGTSTNHCKDQLSSGLNMPHVTEVRRDDWENHSFSEKSALRVVNAGDNSYDFFVNMDNLALQIELKNLRKTEESQLLEAQFKYAMVLIGLAMLHDNHQDERVLEDSVPIEEMVASTTTVLSPIILPMLDALGQLTLDDIVE
ncbi:MAG: hypothetical protein AAFR81_22520, partial [Chloroflexota bacterium]